MIIFTPADSLPPLSLKSAHSRASLKKKVDFHFRPFLTRNASRPVYFKAEDSSLKSRPETSFGSRLKRLQNRSQDWQLQVQRIQIKKMYTNMDKRESEKQAKQPSKLKRMKYNQVKLKLKTSMLEG